MRRTARSSATRARKLIDDMDGFWSPMFIGYDAGAPVEDVATRVMTHVVREIQSIEGLPIESIISRAMHVASDLPVCEDDALLRRIANGEPMTVALQPPAPGIESGLGKSQAEARENLLALKRSRIPRAHVDAPRSAEELDARMRESLRRMEREIATINGLLLATSEDLRPDYYCRCVQNGLYETWQQVDSLAESVEERNPSQATLGGYTMRYIRLGVIKEGFTFAMRKPEEKG